MQCYPQVQTPLTSTLFLTFDDRSLLVSIREKLLENPFANVI
jgi:hypothetical protein